MSTLTLIVAPGAAQEFGFKGDYVRVRKSAVDLTISNPEESEIFEISEGEDQEFSQFKSLLIGHNDAAAQTIKLTVSKGKKAGSAKVGGSVGVNNLPAVNGAFTQSRASVTNANQTIIAANAARRYLLIQNNDAGAILRVTLDGNAATVAQGFRVQPGGVLEVPNFAVSGAINAMMETATGAAGNVEFVTG